MLLKKCFLVLPMLKTVVQLNIFFLEAIMHFLSAFPRLLNSSVCCLKLCIVIRTKLSDYNTITHQYITFAEQQWKISSPQNDHSEMSFQSCLFFFFNGTQKEILIIWHGKTSGVRHQKCPFWIEHKWREYY